MQPLTRPNAKHLTSTDGTIVYAEAVGSPSNPHLVFVHGFSLSTVVFDCIFNNPNYAEQYYLVRYDTRGHGRSGKPRDATAYASEKFAQDFATVMQAFDLKHPVLVCWSLGSSVLVDIAAHLPSDTLSGVVYINPMPYIGEVTPHIATPSALHHVGILQQNEDVALFASTKVAWVDACFGHSDKVPHELKCLWTGAALAATPADLALMINRPQNLEPMLQLARGGELPFLMLQGDRDAIIESEKVVPVVKAMWKDAEVVVLEGIGHADFYEDTEGVMEPIGDFTRNVWS